MDETTTIPELRWIGDDFLIYKNRIFHPNKFMKTLIIEKGIEYAAFKVGMDEVFFGVSDWSGDPWEETSQHAEFTPELFEKFLAAVKAQP